MDMKPCLSDIICLQLFQIINWSIEKINSDDIWSRNYSLDEFKNVLNQDPVYELKLLNNVKQINLKKKYYTYYFRK